MPTTSVARTAASISVATTDHELAARAAAGDDVAFEAILRRHNRLLFLRRACAERAVCRRVQALPGEREAMVTAHHSMAWVGGKGAACTSSSSIAADDNGLAETKNGAVVRKEFGYAHIPQRHAARFITYFAEYLNPFLNFHRPLFATDKLGPKKLGRIKKVYRLQDAMMPLGQAGQLARCARLPAQGHRAATPA